MPQYHYYNQWMRSRLLAAVGMQAGGAHGEGGGLAGAPLARTTEGQLPGAVVECMLRMGADDLELIVSHPLAARAQVGVRAHARVHVPRAQAVRCCSHPPPAAPQHASARAVLGARAPCWPRGGCLSAHPPRSAPHCHKCSTPWAGCRTSWPLQVVELLAVHHAHGPEALADYAPQPPSWEEVKASGRAMACVRLCGLA